MNLTKEDILVIQKTIDELKETNQSLKSWIIENENKIQVLEKVIS